MAIIRTKPHHLERSKGSLGIIIVFASFFLVILLVGCAQRNDLAPVTELRWQSYSHVPSPQSHQKTHTVRRGETLYAIAFHYDTDFRKLAQLNYIRPPYSLRIGQVINLQEVRGGRVFFRPSTPVYSRPVATVNSPAKNTPSFAGWIWPVNGHVTATFIPDQGKKGINIACKKGEGVHAAAAGVVAYAGNGLTGYGNLIIIKHTNNYLTAYGNNARNLVSEGQKITLGQRIAEVGMIDRKYWGVHFEIRKMGIPVNPLNYLKKD